MFKFQDVMKCLSAKQEIHFMNNLGTNQSVTENRPFYVILEKQEFMTKFHKNCDLKTSSRPFYVSKVLSTTFIGK